MIFLHIISISSTIFASLYEVLTENLRTIKLIDSINRIVLKSKVCSIVVSFFFNNLTKYNFLYKLKINKRIR